MKMVLLLLFCAAGLGSSAQDSTQQQFLGKYKFPDGSVVPEVIVTFENNTLNMSSSAGTSVLERIKGDSFHIVSFNGTAVFKRNETKKINGVHIDASGYVLDGVKDDAAMKEKGIASRPQAIKNDAVAFRPRSSSLQAAR